MKKCLIATILGLLSCATQAQQASWVPFAKAEDAVQYRQSAFKLLEHHFARLNKMARGTDPYDATIALQDAAAVQLMSRLPFHAFVSGTAAPFAKSRATDLVWSASPRFVESAAQLQASADIMAQATAVGDINRLKAAASDAAMSCRRCHDQFRVR